MLLVIVQTVQFSQFVKPALVVKYDHVQGINVQIASLEGMGVSFTPVDVVELGQNVDQFVNIFNPSLTGFWVDQNFHLSLLLNSQIIGNPTIRFTVNGIYSSPYAPQLWLRFETTILKFFDVYQAIDPVTPADYALGVQFKYQF